MLFSNYIGLFIWNEKEIFYSEMICKEILLLNKKEVPI